LLKLEEEREKEKNNFFVHQQIIKRWFDKEFEREKDFQVGDLVLKWDKPHEEKGKHFKFQQLWLGPHLVVRKFP